jgi:hypothetical protein
MPAPPAEWTRTETHAPRGRPGPARPRATPESVFIVAPMQPVPVPYTHAYEYRSLADRYSLHPVLQTPRLACGCTTPRWAMAALVEPPAVRERQTSVLSSIDADDLVRTRASLHKSVRRPSLSSAGKDRFQRRELSITHQGWLTKLSRGGLPNWNRRWFIQIGGSLYYSRSPTPSPADLHVFAELEDCMRVELLANSPSLSHAFKLAMTNGSELIFSAPSSDERLTWLAILEQAIGMQAVPVSILLAEIRREAQSAGGAMRLSVVSSDLAEVQAQLVFAREREADLSASVEYLETVVARLRSALAEKDERLWSLGTQLARAHDNGVVGSGAEPALASETGLPSTPVPSSCASRDGAVPTRTASLGSLSNMLSLGSVALGLDPGGRDPPSQVDEPRGRCDGESRADATSKLAAGTVAPSASSASSADGSAMAIITPLPDDVGTKNALEFWGGLPSASQGGTGEAKAATRQQMPRKSVTRSKNLFVRAASVTGKSMKRLLLPLSPRGKAPPLEVARSSQAVTMHASGAHTDRTHDRTPPADTAAQALLAQPPSGGDTPHSSPRTASAAATPRQPAGFEASRAGSSLRGGSSYTIDKPSARKKTRRWSEPSLDQMAAMNATASLRQAPQPIRPAPRAADDGARAVVSFVKEGRLTKLSKGGFTANWNKRAFALLGSSLYAARREHLRALRARTCAASKEQWTGHL